jgi:predicted acetyltransferase
MSNEVLTTPIDTTARASFAEQGLRFDLITADGEEFPQWSQAVSRGFLQSRATDELIGLRRGGFAHRRLSAAWDESSADPTMPVATVSSWVADLTLPGRRSIPGWAISTVSVAPTHRRRGIARALMEAELRTAVALGIPVAMLTVSEATIYGRFGFAPSAMAADWVIDTSRARWIGRTPNGRVHLVPTETARDGGAFDIVERARLTTPGQIYFDGTLWQRLFGMPGMVDPAEYRVARYDDADGVPQGLAIYRAGEKENRETIEVGYLTAASDDAYAALWRYLLEIDLVNEVRAKLRSVDEPLRWQIADARAARVIKLDDHLWTRILDVKTALEARQFSAAGTFVLDIEDQLGFADGAYSLAIDDAGTGTVTRLERDNDFGANHVLAMTVNELAALYLGGTSATTLVAAGRIQEKTRGAANAADAAFRSAVAPWLSIWF